MKTDTITTISKILDNKSEWFDFSNDVAKTYSPAHVRFEVNGGTMSNVNLEPVTYPCKVNVRIYHFDIYVIKVGFVYEPDKTMEFEIKSKTPLFDLELSKLEDYGYASIFTDAVIKSLVDKIINLNQNKEPEKLKSLREIFIENPDSENLKKLIEEIKTYTTELIVDKRPLPYQEEILKEDFSGIKLTVNIKEYVDLEYLITKATSYLNGVGISCRKLKYDPSIYFKDLDINLEYKILDDVPYIFKKDSNGSTTIYQSSAQNLIDDTMCLLLKDE